MGENRRQTEIDSVDTAYDTLFGYLLSTPDLYARAAVVRHLDCLFYWAKKGLSTIQAAGDAATVEAAATSSTETESGDACNAEDRRK